VARLGTTLLRRLRTLLTQRFPPPATVRLNYHDGVYCVITSAEFAGMDTINRQSLIGDIVETHLSSEERRQVQVIVGVTPDEGTGYLAGDE
jgi:hypothetical protein